MKILITNDDGIKAPGIMMESDGRKLSTFTSSVIEGGTGHRWTQRIVVDSMQYRSEYIRKGPGRCWHWTAIIRIVHV